MKIIIAAFNLLAIFGVAFWVWKQQPKHLRVIFLPAFIYKLTAGVALGLIYQHYYPDGDTFSLFDQSIVVTNKFYHDPASYFDFLLDSGGTEYQGHLRSLFFVKLISTVNIFSFNDYWITGAWLSLAIFLCAWRLFKKITDKFPDAGFAGSFAFLFLPSAVFWSSGIIKESVALAALFSLAALWIDQMEGTTPRIWIFLGNAIALLVLWKLKYYWAAVFIPVALTTLIIRKITFRSGPVSIWRYLIGVAVAIIFFYIMTLLHPNFNPSYFLNVLVANHDAYARLSADDNCIHFYDLKPEWMSVFINSPWALVSGLFRPFITESTNLLSFASALENFAILILTLSALARKTWFRSPDAVMAAALIFYVSILSIFLALSTPNFGSLARYKVALTPFFVFIVTYRNPLVNLIAEKLRKQKTN